MPIQTSVERPSQQGTSREPRPLGNLNRYQFRGLYRFEQSSPAVLASFGHDSYSTSSISLYGSSAGSRSRFP